MISQFFKKKDCPLADIPVIFFSTQEIEEEEEKNKFLSPICPAMLSFGDDGLSKDFVSIGQFF